MYNELQTYKKKIKTIQFISYSFKILKNENRIIILISILLICSYVS